MLGDIAGDHDIRAAVGQGQRLASPEYADPSGQRVERGPIEVHGEVARARRLELLAELRLPRTHVDDQSIVQRFMRAEQGNGVSREGAVEELGSVLLMQEGAEHPDRTGYRAVSFRLPTLHPHMLMVGVGRPIHSQPAADPHARTLVSPRYRILFLSWRDFAHPEAGGAEKYLTEVAEGLVARGHQVTIRTASYPGAIPDEVIRGVAYTRRGGRFGVFPRAQLSRLTGRLRADVVVDVQNGVPFLSPLAGRARVINLVHHVHKEQWPVVVGERAAGIGWFLESKVAPRIYRRSDYVAVSESTRSELGGLGVDVARTRVIYNGTDVVADLDVVRSPTPLITVLGRLVPHKQVGIAIDAVAALVPEFPDLHLKVVGSGYWGPTLQEYAHERGVADRVTFTGHVSEAEKHRILAESWVLAFPSLKEGWGLVVVEAGVHGTPSVAFRNAGGLRESIQDGETGLLAEDGVEPFTEALRTVLGDDALRARMALAAQEWVTRFRWSQTVDAWEDLLVGPAAEPPGE